MALTMTRTRTQTTLTRLANLLASLNGELEFVEWLLEEMPAHRVALTVRWESLVANRDAVVATLRQFDPQLAVHVVGSSRQKRSRRAVRQYLVDCGVGSENGETPSNKDCALDLFGLPPE